MRPSFARVLIAGLSLTAATSLLAPSIGAQCPFGGGSAPSYGGPSDATTPSPASPTTPGPASPGAASPRTPGPRTPATPRTGGPGTPRGMQLTFTRQKTSKKMLKVDWRFPKSLELKEQKGHTVTQQRMTALPRDEALAALTKGDKRPLLVLRECAGCKGSDIALLSRKLNNEKTLLLTKWFNCVKLPQNVMQKHHTFHSMFAGKNAPHLYLMTRNGETSIPLNGQQSQALLWKDMTRVLRQSYRKDPEAAVKQIFALMTKYDHFDSMASQYQEQLEIELEKSGPKSGKVKRLRAKLEKIESQKARAKADEARARDLGLIE